jgi:ribonuclease T
MSDTNSQEIYVSVDVETAGPIPAAYSLLTLGACIVGEPDQSFYVELKPINTNAIPEALKVGGLSLSELAERGEEPSSAFKRFQTWVIDTCGPDRRPVFVGFNAGFDWAFVNWYFHTYIGENPFGFAPLDVKAYYMGLLGCRWSDTTSSKLLSAYKPTQSIATHNALDDAKAQAETFQKLLAASRT